jgi:hypothetical protein
LNPRLDYSSDSHDGPLITGEHLEDSQSQQAESRFHVRRRLIQLVRRSVNLYRRYKDRVQFVVIDLDRTHSPAQQELLKNCYPGYIPRVAILGSLGKAVYNAAGEVDESRIADMLLK